MNIGLDFIGLLYFKVKGSFELIILKVYVCIFICEDICVVYFELLNSMMIEDFL